MKELFNNCVSVKEENGWYLPIPAESIIPAITTNPLQDSIKKWEV